SLVLPAPREMRQGGAPSLRRLSKQPRKFSRSPLLATTTWLYNWDPTLALALAVRPLRPPGVNAVPPWLRRTRCHHATGHSVSPPTAAPAPPRRPACRGGPQYARPSAAACPQSHPCPRTIRQAAPTHTARSRPLPCL